MNKVVCGPVNWLPELLDSGVDYFSIYEHSGRPNVSSVGTGILRDIKVASINPDIRTWDFLSFALAVSSADLAVVRSSSADGWTRMIQLHVALIEPSPFVQIRTELEEMLRFLTGDFWSLVFTTGGYPLPLTTAPKSYDADCVSLLSGGIDSLVGAIDLTQEGRRPFFVSQMAKGDSSTQVRYAHNLGGHDRHLQLNHNIRVAHKTERSTRGRSIVFFAFAALAASALLPGMPRVNIYVPENGFISLNVPLNPGRSGSLSTKTTHPVFMSRLQDAWNALGMKNDLVRLYAFKTKGELIAECQDQVRLNALIGESTSCGRFGYYNYMHCGRCVPCLVRRASFMKAGITDTTTKGYHFGELDRSGRKAGANDIGAVASAILKAEAHGIHKITTGQLYFAVPSSRSDYEGVVQRGLDELKVLLAHEGVL